MGDAAPLPQDDPKYVAPQGDPHDDTVLENGPADPPEPETPAPGETPPEPETPPAPPVAETPPAHKPDWRDKELGRRKRRLDEESARATAAEARAKAAEDLAASLARQPPAETPPGETPPRQPQERVYTQAELDAEADRRADIKAQNVTFQRDFASAVESANKSFGKNKVNEAIARISELGGLDVDHLHLVLATDDPGKVIFELGAKPEEFQRIMDLPFARRAVEFTKMGLKTETPVRRPSGAPPPVEPLGGSGGGGGDNRYNDKVSDAEWFEAEKKREAVAWKKKQEGWRG